MNLCSSQGSCGPGKQHSFFRILQQVPDQVTLRTQAIALRHLLTPNSPQTRPWHLLTDSIIQYPGPQLSPTQALARLLE